MIKIFITGGTIDCLLIKDNEEYSFGDTNIPKLLDQGRCKLEIKSEVLMMKDSLLITEEDRNIILDNCANCNETQIVITHGTDTMVETAKVLGKNISDKTIVLLGAMIPYNQENSDAMFNLGCAISAAQTLPYGIYITMNGKIFSWNNVKKNKALGIFETLS